MEVFRTCLRRGGLGNCRYCQRDYGPNRPNNLDCPRYVEIQMTVVDVKPRETRVSVIRPEV